MTETQAVIFDLDGTLTTLEVDFTELKRRLGVTDGPLWEAILRMGEPDRRRAEKLLVSAELQGAHKCVLIPGAKDVLDQLRKWKIPCAILTRNCRQALQIAIARHGLHADASIAREDTPLKPDPAGVIELAKRLNVDPTRTLVVGDYLYDLQAGRRAGATTVLFRHDAKGTGYEHLADHVIHDLRELFDIVVPPGGSSRE